MKGVLRGVVVVILLAGAWCPAIGEDGPSAARRQGTASPPAAASPPATAAPDSRPTPVAVADSTRAAAAPDSAATRAPVVSRPAVTDTSLVFVIRAGNRLWPDWKEEHRAKIGMRFSLGDTDNSAVVTKLLPDFRIIDAKPVSISDAMNNPAIRVVVYQDSAAVDSSWAFLNFPPHFARTSFFAFQLLEVVGYGGGAAPAKGN